MSNFAPKHIWHAFESREVVRSMWYEFRQLPDIFYLMRGPVGTEDGVREHASLRSIIFHERITDIGKQGYDIPDQLTFPPTAGIMLVTLLRLLCSKARGKYRNRSIWKV